MPDEAKIQSLEDRVQKLENWIKIAAGVAVIFGISGAWGLSSLQAAQKQLSELQNGIATVQRERDSALSDLKRAEASELADIRAKAKPLVKEAVSQEIAEEIGSTKKWTAYVFATAAQTGLPPGGGASGWWQKALIDQNALAQKELK